MTINDTGDSGNGQWLKYLECRCLWSRKYLNIGLRGHNNVCIMAEGEPVPYDPTLIGLSETSTAFTCADTHAPVCNGRTPAFYLITAASLVDFAPVYFIFHSYLLSLHCNVGLQRW